MADFKEFSEAEQDELVKTTIEDDYKNFLDAKRRRFGKKFLMKNIIFRQIPVELKFEVPIRLKQKQNYAVKC